MVAARVVRGGGGSVRADGGRLLLGAAGEALELTEIRPPGGRPMTAADWLRGRQDGRLTDFVVAASERTAAG